MPLINCKIDLELNWIEDYISSSAGDSAKFKIADAKLHVPIVTLSTKDKVNLTKQLSDEFKRSVYWKSYRTILAKVINQRTNLSELLSALFQDVKRLFVLAMPLLQMLQMMKEVKKKVKTIFFQGERLKIMTY